MKEYIGIEIGVSAYIEFLIDGEFVETCDGIYLGRVFALSKEEAEKKIRELGRDFDKVLIYEVFG